MPWAWPVFLYNANQAPRSTPLPVVASAASNGAEKWKRWIFATAAFLSRIFISWHRRTSLKVIPRCRCCTCRWCSSRWCTCSSGHTTSDGRCNCINGTSKAGDFTGPAPRERNRRTTDRCDFGKHFATNGCGFS